LFVLLEYVVVAVNVSEPVNVSRVEFLGPFFVRHKSYTDYHFVCRLILSHNDSTAVFDVALTFDGKMDRSLLMKTATVPMLDVRFAPDDFGQHFGQMVSYLFSHVTDPMLFFYLSCQRFYT